MEARFSVGIRSKRGTWLRGGQWNGELLRLFRERLAYRCASFIIIEDQATGTNAIIYECGMGDGAYEVWLGLNADGQVAEIFVDLELLSRSTGTVS